MEHSDPTRILVRLGSEWSSEQHPTSRRESSTSRRQGTNGDPEARGEEVWCARRRPAISERMRLRGTRSAEARPASSGGDPAKVR